MTKSTRAGVDWLALRPQCPALLPGSISPLLSLFCAKSSSRLLRLTTCKRRSHTQSNQRPARYILLGAAQTCAPAKPLRNRPGRQGPNRIAPPAHQRKQQTQFENLQRGMPACRLNELRQKCEEKQGGLGIQKVHQHALSENPA